MLRIVKGFVPWILIDCFEEKFYIRWSVGRSPRVHEVNPGRDHSWVVMQSEVIVFQILHLPALPYVKVPLCKNVLQTLVVRKHLELFIV